MMATEARASRAAARIAIALPTAVAVVSTGLIVARFPLLVVVVLVAIPVLLIVGRSLSRDVEYLAAGVLLISGLVGLPRQVQLGPVSLGGVLSVVELAAATLMLLHDSGQLAAVWRGIWPLIAFLLWSWFSLLPSEASVDGFQNAVVYTAFIAIATLAYVRTVDEPSFAERLETLFERTFWLVAVLGIASVVRFGPGEGFLVRDHAASRAFALLLLPMIAAGLSMWRYGDRRHGAPMAVAGLVLVALTLSRAAFVTACVLFALARFTPRSILGLARFVAAAVVTVGLLWAGITFIPPLHERFFTSQGDLVRVGGYEFNASGRSEVWSLTWAEFERSPWFGHGAGASEEFLTAQVIGARHPHNDYLRLLNDYGVIGACFWALGIVLIVSSLYRRWLRRDARGDPRARFQLWGLLSLAALLATMIPDNPLVYMHVQGPLALVVGIALQSTETDSSVARVR